MLDTKQLAQTFANDPFVVEVRWITLLAFTNLLPTVLHLSFLIKHLHNGGAWFTDKNMRVHVQECFSSG